MSNKILISNNDGFYFYISFLSVMGLFRISNTLLLTGRYPNPVFGGKLLFVHLR